MKCDYCPSEEANVVATLADGTRLYVCAHWACVEAMELEKDLVLYDYIEMGD